MKICVILWLAKHVPFLYSSTHSFATPRFQKPLKLSADVAVHSSTKYIGGHADLLGGVIAGRKKQMSGFGGMITFGIKGGIEAGRKLMNRVELCTICGIITIIKLW